MHLKKYIYLLPLKKSGLNRRPVQKLGFNVSSYMWKNCTNESKRSKGNSIILLISNGKVQ